MEKKLNGPKIHAFTRHVKICHRSYIQVEEPILCTVQLCILYTTDDGTANALESTEATGGIEALTDCDVKMMVVLELLTQLSIKQLSSMT